MKDISLQYSPWQRPPCKGELCEVYLSVDELCSWALGQWPANSEVLKAEPRRQTRKLEWNGRRLLVKTFAPTFCLLPDRAAAAHKKTLHLQSLGIQVPASLGYAVGGGDCLSLHVAEWLDDAVPWLSFVGEPELDARLTPALDDLIEQLARLHIGGLVHGDFKWGNLLLMRGEQNWLVDLDSLRRARPGRSGARDLARFVVDCEEAGSSADFIRRALEIYGLQRGWDLPRVQRWTEADYQKIRERHRRRYGADHRL
jgi:tRNA A-37 threonylcarbamoyl transferase component Bud32